MLLSSGAVSMWDHMSLIRGALQKKIMPPICRVLSISQILVTRDFKDCETREEIIKKSKSRKEHALQGSCQGHKIWRRNARVDGVSLCHIQ
jgi:hypothetical protein